MDRGSPESGGVGSSRGIKGEKSSQETFLFNFFTHVNYKVLITE
jgi:hypothetical protein